MITLLVTALLSQAPVAPEAFKKFDSNREALLAALAKQKKCKLDDADPKGACIAAAFSTGTSGPIASGVSKFIGVAWVVKPARGGKVTVSAPELQAMTFNKDSVGVWGAVTSLKPQNAKERQKLQQLTRDLVAKLDGAERDLAAAAELSSLLELVATNTQTLVESGSDGYRFKGAPTLLRSVGSQWVLLGTPTEGEGLVAGVFIPLPDEGAASHSE